MKNEFLNMTSLETIPLVSNRDESNFAALESDDKAKIIRPFDPITAFSRN